MRSASFNSAVKDMTNLMIWARVISSPLLAGMGIYLERNMWESYWMRALL